MDIEHYFKLNAFFEKNDLIQFKKFCIEHQIDLNSYQSYHDPFIVKWFNYGDEARLHTLIELKVNLNYYNRHGTEHLIFSDVAKHIQGQKDVLDSEDLRVLKLLVKNGLNLNEKNVNFYAYSKDTPELWNYLFEQGSDVNSQNKNSSVSLIEFLLYTPIHFVYFPLLKFLISHDIDCSSVKWEQVSQEVKVEVWDLYVSVQEKKLLDMNLLDKNNKKALKI